MRWLVLGVLGAALLGGTLGLALDGEPRPRPNGFDEGRYRGSEPPGRLELPRFSLRNYDGRRLNSNELRGRIVVLTFLDSQCTDTCPILASQIGQTIGRLTAAEREEWSRWRSAPTRAKTRRQASGHSSRNSERSESCSTSAVRSLRCVRFGSDSRSSRRSSRARTRCTPAPVRIYDRDGVWVATLHAGVDLSEVNLLHDIRAALAADGDTSR